jgi:hypothetical protein
VKHQNSSTSDGEIMAISKVLLLLMKMEADIIAEKGKLTIPPEIKKEVVCAE